MIPVRPLRSLRALILCLAALAGFAAPASFAQSTSSAVAALKPVAQSNRIAANPDLREQTQLAGHLPPWVRPSAQVASKSIDLGSTMHLFVFLKRDPAAQAAMDKMAADQQDPSSPFYHQWLTPKQIGDLYGPTASDIAQVSAWLSSQGLTVLPLGPTRIAIEATGSAALVANAFRTNFAYFDVGGSAHYSATSEPTVPTALAPVIASIGGLTEELLAPQHTRKIVSPSDYVKPAGNTVTPTPELTSGSSHFLMPNDFAVIYDLNPVYATGNKGATIAGSSQHVAIVGRSRVTTTDISTFATYAAISSYTLNQIVPTGATDPNVTNTGDQDEATLDVDRVIGTAPGAVVDLLISSNAGGGIAAGLNYNVNTLTDPVMNISFGACEQAAGSSNVSQDDAFFQAAAMEGISTFVSSGDQGVAACSTAFANPPSTTPVAGINYLCSSSYVTCVGGTEFNDTASPSTYWSSSNGTGYVSALSYIPEGAWNEPSSSGGTSTGYQIAATGGGPSLYISKPSWQTGTGVPADGKRDTPDVSFTAAGHDGYFACLDYALSSGHTCAAGYFLIFSGTSASAPGMAGVAALLNTKLGAAQGNINPLLYKIAASTPAAFHDATPTSSGVGTCAVTTASMCNNTTPSQTGLTGGLQGYPLTAGYDLSTGLGSLDVSAFITAAAPTTTTLAVAATPNPANVNQTVTLTATLTPANTNNGSPTGTVTFYSNGTAIGSAVPINGNIATATTTFSTTGTYSITATYSGDTNYATSTASAYSLVVNAAAAFSVTPAAMAISLISGATTGNTDTITVASLNNFAGGVTLTCNVANASGTAAGTCSLSPGSVTLTAGGSAPSTLTINTTPGTSGALNVTVTGTSGSTVVTTSNIVVTLTAASYTMSAAPSSLNLTSGATTGNTSVVTLTSVNGFTGTVAITCTAAKTSGTAAGSCSASPSSVTLPANGTATTTITLTSTAGTSGGLTLTVSGSGAPTGGTIAATASTTISVTLTTPTFTLSAAPATLNLVSGATTGNTSVVTFTSVNGFAGPINVACTATNASGTAAGSCSASPSTVTLAAGGTGTSTITLTSTPGTSGTLNLAVTGTSGTVSASLSTPIVATLTAASFSFSLSANSLNITSGATAGNTDTVTINSSNGFAGSVALSCSISFGTAAFPPTCAVNPSTITLSGTATTTTATVTISSTTAQANRSAEQASLGWSLKGGTLFAALLCLVPFRRRRAFRILAMFCLLAIGLATLSGCGGGGSAPTPKRSSAGTYTVTVSGAGTTAGATQAATTSTTFTLTIN